MLTRAEICEARGLKGKWPWLGTVVLAAWLRSCRLLQKYSGDVEVMQRIRSLLRDSEIPLLNRIPRQVREVISYGRLRRATTRWLSHGMFPSLRKLRVILTVTDFLCAPERPGLYWTPPSSCSSDERSGS
jgi:hypothetical protein